MSSLSFGTVKLKTMKSTFLSSIALCALILFSFTSGKKPSFKSAKKSLEEFCNYIPSGSTIILNKDVSIQAFYMSTTEITNFQYAEFLHSLKKNGELEKLAIAQVDSSKWSSSFPNTYLKPMQEYYFRHPAYRDYPVVNVSKEGAVLYCEWLTKVYDSLSNGELRLKFRIPTRTEWIYAANGGDVNLKYAWGGPFIRNAKGSVLANFTQVGAENITRDPSTGKFIVVKNLRTLPITDDADITAPAQSYWPNDFGLYNMNGNVAEMVADGNFAVGGDWHSPGYDIRNESIKAFDSSHPTVGFRVVASFLQASK